MWLEDYSAEFTIRVGNNGLHQPLFRIAAVFDLMQRFVFEVLLHWGRFEKEGASKFPRVEYSAVPMLRHREGAGKIASREMRQHHAEELRLKRVSVNLHIETRICNLLRRRLH